MRQLPTASGAPRVTRAFMLTLGAGLVVYNSIVHFVPGYTAVYVPVNVLAAVVLLAVSAHVGMSTADLGLDRTTWRTGLVWGGWVAAVAAVVLAIGVAVPVFHPWFDDARLSDIGPGLVAYRALIRIPLGTALFEEFAFRGVLFGAWQRIATSLRAAIGSSVAFGLWHIRPTIELLDANDLAGGSLGRAAVVVAAVLGTTAAGYLFCLLRVQSRSLLAPLVAHAAINSLAIVAAYIVTS